MSREENLRVIIDMVEERRRGRLKSICHVDGYPPQLKEIAIKEALSSKFPDHTLAALERVLGEFERDRGLT